jgi:RNA ligase (TIGR02306 family)
MERKLASIRQISEIREIPGADAIELAIVDGWQVVVAKNVNHKVGNYVVYCEIDSFLPIKPEFEFLRKSSYKKMGDQEGFRLKTIKLRGQISQGLILPLDEVIPFPNNLDYMEVGKDVTELLGIVKYEPPIPAELAGKVKGMFPSFIPKTDEERVQNLVSEYENWKVQSQHQFYVTEKLDGSSATFYYKDGVFGVCSRNLELLETEGNTFWKVARELDLENKMKEYGKNISLQGELIGEGIQGNPYKIKGHTVRFFTGYEIDKQKRINFVNLVVLLQSMGLEYVPVLNREFGFILPDSVEEMLKYAEGKSVLTPDTEREGVVVRSMDGTISFKAISNKFLLKND